MKERKNPPQQPSREPQSSGDMSVREAGHKGGQKVRELIERGKGRTSEK
jgi:hypothetical protein